MTPKPPAGPRLEPLEAGRGLLRLFAFSARWQETFDFSRGGFLRSFFGPLMALPFYIFHIALVEATQVGHPLTWDVVGAATGEHLCDAYGFLLVVVLAARLLNLAGFPSFAVVMNWGTLWLNAALGLASPLLMAGADGVDTFRMIYLVLLVASVVLVWRAARETLTRELPVILLLVLLSIGWSVAVSQLGDLLLTHL
jgi:hypothetical protein